MTTTTNIAYQTTRVPVRTALEKAILAVTFAQAVHSEAEALGRDDGLDDLWCGTKAWSEPNGTDQMIDRCQGRREGLRRAEELLDALRALTPGKDAGVDVPGCYGLLERLDNTIQSLKETDADDLIGCECTQRQIAEATIAAIDLQETVAQIQEAMAGGDA
jgi:hypothetical protein